MTGHVMPRFDLFEERLNATADIHNLFAAGLKPAARRRIDGLRYLALDIRYRLSVRWIGDGHCRNERFGIGMERICRLFLWTF